MEFWGLGRGAHAAQSFVADARLDGADEPGALTECGERRVHEVGRGRLAVGPGDAEHAQREVVGAEDPGRDRPEHGPRLLDHEQGQVDRGVPHPARPDGIREHGERSGCRGGRDEVGAVGSRAREGCVEVPRQHGARVEGDTRDADVRKVGCGCSEQVREGSDRGAAQRCRSRYGHVAAPYPALRLRPSRSRVGSASASSGETLMVISAGFAPVGGIFSSCSA